MRLRIIALACAGLAAALTVATTPPTVADDATATGGTVDVRVGSFNVLSVGLDKKQGAQRPWKRRRGAIVRQVLDERVDVLGVQEVNPSRAFRDRLRDAATQFKDLQRGLNKAGGNYRLTNHFAFNCVRSRTQWHCKHKSRGASHSNRILYDADTVELVRQGSLRYRHQGSPKSPDYLAWAVLRAKDNGREFLFTTTHLQPHNTEVLRAQWQEMIDKIDQVRGDLPVIATGDFNTHKYAAPAREMYPAMRQAGYGDVLNQQYRTNPVEHPRAEHTVNGWLNTYNHKSRDVATYGYENRLDKTGNGIDLIFASNQLEVKEYKVVLSFDPQTLRVRGVLPSDHNMIRATVALPSA